MTYGTALGPLSFPSLALLSGWEIIIQWPYSTSVPLNGCALSMLHCQGASATWPNCNRLQSALGSDPRLCISAFLPISLSRDNEPAPPRRTEISINQRGTMGAWMCQSEDECSAERIVPGLLYAHIHRSEYCVGGHSTMSILR